MSKVDYKKVSRHLVKIADLYNATDLTHKYWASRTFQRAALKIADLSDGFPMVDLKALDGIGDAIQSEVMDFVNSDYNHLTEKFVNLSNRMADGRVPHEIIAPLVQDILHHLRDIHSVPVLVAGSFRRKQATSKDLDFVVICETDKEIQEFKDALTQLCGWEKRYGKDARISGTVSNVPVDFRICTQHNLVPAMMFFTGPMSNNVNMRSAAKAKGWKLNEYGLFDSEGKAILPTTAFERDYYKALGVSDKHAHWLLTDPVISVWTGQNIQQDEFVPEEDC